MGLSMCGFESKPKTGISHWHRKKARNNILDSRLKLNTDNRSPVQGAPPYTRRCMFGSNGECDLARVDDGWLQLDSRMPPAFSERPRIASSPIKTFGRLVCCCE